MMLTTLQYVALVVMVLTAISTTTGNNRRNNRRNNRNRDVRSHSQTCVIHFVVDKRAYQSGFKGESSKQTAMNFWKGSNLTTSVRNASRRCAETFTYSKGVLTVKQEGLYYIYGQVTYETSQEVSGYSLKTGNDKTLMKCIVNRQPDNTSQFVPCFTARAVYLEAHQTVRMHNTEEYWRNITTDEATTFWGIYRM